MKVFCFSSDFHCIKDAAKWAKRNIVNPSGFFLVHRTYPHKHFKNGELLRVENEERFFICREIRDTDILQDGKPMTAWFIELDEYSKIEALSL